MRKVLIPLQITEVSAAILPVVRNLFEPGQVELTLLTVAQPPEAIVATDSYITPMPPSAHVATMNQEEYAAYRQKLEVDLKHEAQNLRQIGYSVDTVVRSGDPVREILAAVKEKKYDLLAMATRGRKGLTRLVLGSVAESVLRDSPIPMLLVRPKSEGEGGEV